MDGGNWSCVVKDLYLSTEEQWGYWEMVRNYLEMVLNKVVAMGCGALRKSGNKQPHMETEAVGRGLSLKKE